MIRKRYDNIHVQFSIANRFSIVQFVTSPINDDTVVNDPQNPTTAYIMRSKWPAQSSMSRQTMNYENDDAATEFARSVYL